MIRWKNAFVWIIPAVVFSLKYVSTVHDGEFYDEILSDSTVSPARSAITFSTNETYPSTEKCIDHCQKTNYPIAAIENAHYCFCFLEDAVNDGILKKVNCEAPINTNGIMTCENQEYFLSLYSVNTSEVKFVIISFENDLNTLLVDKPITATVNGSSSWNIDWGDGSEHSTEPTKTYTIGGTFLVSAYLENDPEVRSIKYLKVHEPPNQDIVCPSLLEVSVPDKCNVTVYRQGYNYLVSYNMTIGPSTQEFSSLVPEETKLIVGSFGASDSFGTLTEDEETKIIVLMNSLVKSGGFIFRVRAEVETTGSIALYAVTPACDSTKVYCGVTDTCLATCPDGDAPLSCDPLISDISSCASNADGSRYLETFTYTLLTVLDITATVFDEELQELVMVPSGSLIGVGCVQPDCSGIAKIKYVDASGLEDGDSYLSTSDIPSALTSTNRRHMVQVGIREHPLPSLDANLLCEHVAPIPLSDLTTPFSAETEKYISEGTLEFSFTVRNPLTEETIEEPKIVCQQSIPFPTLETEIWMEFGKEFLLDISFSQGSPLFSIFDIDGSLSYDYKDDASNGYNFTLTLSYSNEGLFLFTGNTSNLLGSVLYNSTIHVVPPVTDNWELDVLCPCYNIEQGFNYTLNLPSAPHPPWNVTLDSFLISENGDKIPLKNEIIVDFSTFGNNGAAVPLTLEYNANVNLAGTYNLTVKMWNEISKTVLSSTVIVEEGIRDVSAHILINSSGILMPPMGVDKDIVLGNFTTIFYPYCRTGEPLKWKLTINETEEVVSIQNITHIFDEVGTYVIKISGYNTIQKWVDSPPIILRVVFKIKGFIITDDSQIKKPGTVKQIIGEFTIFTPLACIYINYGDDKAETFGYDKRCKSKYPNTPYQGEVQAPVVMDHIYQSEGIYTVTALASDEEASFTSELDVVIADIQCTMPVVKIVNGVKSAEMAPSYFKSIGALIETTASYECNKTVPVKRWWAVFEIDPETDASIRDVTVINVLSSWNYSQLKIPSNFLPYGIYKATYYLSILASSVIHLKRNDFTYINIIKTPLKAIMLEGSPSTLSRGFGQLLYFNPEDLSKDPDDPQNKNLNFTWWCRQLSPKEDTFVKDSKGRIEIYNEQSIPKPVSAPVGDGCFGTGAGTITTPMRNKQFDTSCLTRQTGTYEFVMEVQKDTRRSTASLILEVVPEPPPAVVIKCDPSLCFPAASTLIINPTNRLVLYGYCSSDCGEGITYKWSIKSVNGNDVNTVAPCEKQDPIAEGCERAFFPQDTSEAIFSTEFFSINPTVEEFKIKLSLTTNDLKTGFTEVKVKKNKPPERGSCTLSINSGYAMITKFTVDCGGWVDPEQLGIKSISYFFAGIVDGKKFKTVLASTTLTPIDLLLSVGNFSLLVEIADTLGGITSYPLENVTVFLPDKESVDDFDFLSKIEYYTSTGDQATLAMLLNAQSSIKDNADWLALDDSMMQNLTSDEQTGRLTTVSELNNDQLKAVSNSMSFETLKQIEVGANVVEQTMSGIFNSNLSSLTIDMETRELALSTLEKMSEKLQDVQIVSPKDLEPYLSSVLESSHALMLGISQVLTLGESQNIVPPTDENRASSLDYDVDIGVNDYDMVVPTEKNQMYKQNVLKTTKMNAKNQVERINNILHTTLTETRKRMVTNEKVETTASHGASVLLWKITEEVLKDGLEIPVQNNRGMIRLPKSFCPSRYIYSGTNCKKEFVITAVVWPTINYLYPETTYLLDPDTSVVSLEVNIEDQLVDVSNETIGISLKIPRQREAKVEWILINAKENMSHAQNFVYHTFNVSRYDSGYLIEIMPHEDTLPFNTVLLIDHERIPTPWKYMKLVLVKDLPTDANGTSTYYLVKSDENNNKTGRFFVGVGAIKNLKKVNENVTLTKNDFDEDFSLSYYFRAISAGCYYFDEELDEWMNKGLKMIGATSTYVECLANHTTSFGSGFFPLPNKLNFEYIFANPGFIDNLSLYITLIILVSLYIIMMIWGHWMDRKDVQRRGVIPLPDNKSEDKYLYEITFYTGPDNDATTDSNIKLILSGDYDETDVRLLPPANNFLYRRFAVNSFVMAVPRPLGNINFLRVFHDNSGEPPLDNWQLQLVVVRDLQSAEKYVFDTNAWLAFDRENYTVDRIFTLSVDDEKEFTKNMYIRSNKAANQDHMWMSIFLRPSGSRYSRKERITVCSVFLFLSMLFSAIWHNASSESERNGLLILGPFTFSTDMLLIGVCIILVGFPVVYFLTLIFKRARPKNLRLCRAIESIENQRKAQLEEQGLSSEDAVPLSKVEIDNTKKAKPKDRPYKKCIPWWTRVLAWILCFVIIAISLFLVWSYGIMWGEIKTSKWLSSFILSFLLSVIIGQWIKVFVISFLSSTVVKYDLATEDIDCDEELPHLKMDENWYHQKLLDPSIRRKVYKVEGVDTDNPEVDSIREKLFKNREIKLILKDILRYCLFLVVIFVITTERTDRNGILLKNHYEQTFIKKGHEIFDFAKKVKTSSDWWRWAKNVILSELRAQRKYNNEPPYGLRGFLNDHANRMMGYAIIRQIRSKRHNCEVPTPLDIVIDRCSGSRGLINEESKDFCADWTLNETFKGSCNLWNEFHYKSPAELKTFTSLGRLGWYSGGGYVFMLTGSQSVLLKRMDELQQHHWIDKNTRAVMLEFSTYNANTNLFSLCTVTAEFNEGGGVIPKWRFDPFKLIKSPGLEGYIYYACEILFAISTVLFTLNELWKIKKLKLRYFDSYWNIAEICLLLVSYITISLYFYRYVLTQEALNAFKVTKGNGYVKMDSAANIDQYYLYGMATIVFFSILKLIKLLQFNKRMNVLSLTIRGCWDDLKMFLFAFAIIFFGFACLFFFMFSNSIEHFAQIIPAIQTTFKMMMGKFDSQEMIEVNPYSPILFFIFSVANNMIMINITLTVIIQTFNHVKMELENKDNRLNVIDYVWSSFRQFIRKENLPKIHVQPKLGNKIDTGPDSKYEEKDSDHLPDKVDQLVQYINNVYFDGRLDINDPNIRKSFARNSAEVRFLSSKDQKQYNSKTIIGED